MAPLLAAAAVGVNNTDNNTVACKLHPNRHGHAGVCALCLRYRLCVVSVHDQTRNLPDSDSDSDLNSGVEEDARLVNKAELWRGDDLYSNTTTTTKNDNQDGANLVPLRRFSSASEADRHRRGGALMPLLYPLPEPGRRSDAATLVPYWAGKRAGRHCGDPGLVKPLPPASGGRNSGGGRRVSDLHQPRSGGTKEAARLSWVSLFLLRFRHRHTAKEEVEKEKVEKEEKGGKSHLSELARPSFAEIDRNNYELCPEAPSDRIAINSLAPESVPTRHSRSHSHSHSHSSQRSRSVGLRTLWRSHSTRHCSDNLRQNPGTSANYLPNPNNSSSSLDLTNPTESSLTGVNLQNPNINTTSPAGVKLPNLKTSSPVSANYPPNSDYPSPAGANYLPNPNNTSSLDGVNLPNAKRPSLAVASLPSPKRPSSAGVNLPNPNNLSSEGVNLPNPNCSSSAAINLANPNYSSLAGVNLPNPKNLSSAGVNLSNPNYSSTVGVNVPNPNHSFSAGANIPNPNNPSLAGINCSNPNNPSLAGASLPNANCSSSAAVNPPNPDYSSSVGVNLQNPNNTSSSLLSSIRSRDYSAFNFYFSPLRNSRRRSSSPAKLSDPKGD